MVAFQYAEGAYKKDGERLFTRAWSDRTRGMDSDWKRVSLDWILERSSLL